MAGVKGKSGGARAGAGRKPGPKPEPVAQDGDMLEILQNIARGLTDATPLQVRAAIAAVQYTHPKVGESGKKGKVQDKAGDVARGRFTPGAPPLRVVGKG